MSRRFLGSIASRAARAAARRDDDRGAVLILALVILTVGVITAGAISYQVSNDLRGSAAFKSARSTQYAARSATNLAIQNIRYSPRIGAGQTLNASPPATCWGSGAESAVTNIDGVAQMASWCSTVWNPTNAVTRTVTISTCLGQLSAAQCAAAPLLLAVVSFDDYPPGVSAPSASQCVVYCGTSMTINSWVWSSNVPTVSAISPTSGSISGGTPMTITGTGFVAGSTVNFVEESGGVPTMDNQVVVVPASGVTVNSPTSISVVVPAVTVGVTYFVTVTTPSGTSAYGSNDIFTFGAVPPTVTSLSPSVGSIAGGTSMTVTGTGFVKGAVVRFTQESGGTVVSGGAVLSGNYVNIVSSTSLTVVTPGVIIGSTYFVTVITTSGTSPTSGASIFTYSPLVPTVSSVSPTFGPNAGGTPIVVTGTGFFTGATVSFVKVSSGCSSGSAVAAKNVVVTSSSSISAASPLVSSAGQYYVYVTTGSGSSSCYPIYNYTG